MMMVAAFDEVNVKLQLINETVNEVAERDLMFFNKFYSPKDSVDQEKFEWVEKNLVGMKDELVTAITANNQTTIRVKSSGTHGFRRFVVAGDIKTVFAIRVAGAIEHIQVTAIDQQAAYADLTVVRGVEGTTALAKAPVGTQVIILSSTPTEGSAVTGDLTQLSVKKDNLIQTYVFQISQTERNQELRQVGKDNSIAKQLMDGTKELKKLIQADLFHGYRHEAGAGTSRITKSGGLSYWANLVGNRKDVGGKKLSYDVMNDVLKNMLDNGVEANNVMLAVPFRQQEAMNELKEYRIAGAQSQSDNTINNYVEYYRFASNASVKIAYCHELAEDEVFFFDDSKISICPVLSGGGFFKEREQAKVGLVDSRFIKATAGFKVVNAKECLYHYTGFSVGGNA